MVLFWLSNQKSVPIVLLCRQCHPPYLTRGPCELTAALVVPLLLNSRSALLFCGLHSAPSLSSDTASGSTTASFRESLTELASARALTSIPMTRKRLSARFKILSYMGTRR